MTELQLNIDKQVDFLVQLLNIPSPTGYHVEAIPFIRKAFDDLNVPDLTIHETNKGALILTWKGESSDKPRGLTAHTDTLGLMVKDIKGNGRLKVTQLGGLTLSGAEYENVTVRTHDNKRIRGTFIHHNPSSHVNASINKSERSLKSMEIRLDAKVSSAKEVEELGIGVGDFVFLDPRVEVVDTGFIRSRFLDNKAGVANIYGSIMALHEAGLKPKQDTTFMISNYEEVGHGGAYGFPDNLAELVTIDMAAIGDGQTSDEFSVTICVKDGGGPYHFDLNNHLRALCDTHKIDYKVDIYVYYASDGTAYWRSGGGAKVALIGPGVASSHAYERTHKDALRHSTHLIARYLLS